MNETIAAFREDFRTASQHRTVRQYKRLHDELHTFTTTTVNSSTTFAGFLTKLPSALFGTVPPIGTSVLELKRVQRRPRPMGRPQTGSVVRGRRPGWGPDRNQRGSPCDYGDRGPAAGAGAGTGRLDSRRTARREHQRQSAGSPLRRVRDSLASSSPGSRLVDRFGQGRASLETLENEWKALIALHKGGRTLRRRALIDESIGDAGDADAGLDGLHELQVQFDFLTEAIASWCVDTGDWLDRLRRVHEASASRGAAHDAARGSKHVIRSLTGRRFKNLDTKLKELCASCRSWKAARAAPD